MRLPIQTPSAVTHARDNINTRPAYVVRCNGKLSTKAVQFAASRSGQAPVQLFGVYIYNHFRFLLLLA
jgi:hypothetical protein